MRTDAVLSRTSLVWAAVALMGLTGCPSDRETPSETGASLEEPELAPGITEPAEIELTSTAFEPGGPIPAKYTGDGDDVSPALAWSGVPEGTKELALICDDPDAPRPSPWVHWVLYKIPADCEGLPEGVPTSARPDDPPGAIQGKNTWPTVGYRGPKPPRGHGPHRYFFKLYALDTELELGPEAEKEQLLKAMSRRVVGKGQLMGTYER